MFGDVLVVVDQLVAQQLFEVRTDRYQARNPVDHIACEVKTIQLIEHGHVERGGGGSLLAVAMHVKIGVVGAFVGQPVNEGGIAVERKDYRFVRRKDGVEVLIG